MPRYYRSETILLSKKIRDSAVAWVSESDEWFTVRNCLDKTILRRKNGFIIFYTTPFSGPICIRPYGLEICWYRKKVASIHWNPFLLFFFKYGDWIDVFIEMTSECNLHASAVRGLFKE